AGAGTRAALASFAATEAPGAIRASAASGATAGGAASAERGAAARDGAGAAPAADPHRGLALLHHGGGRHGGGHRQHALRQDRRGGASAGRRPALRTDADGEGSLRTGIPALAASSAAARLLPLLPRRLHRGGETRGDRRDGGPARDDRRERPARRNPGGQGTGIWSGRGRDPPDAELPLRARPRPRRNACPDGDPVSFSVPPG